MATNKDTQDVLEDNHQSIESNKSRALTLQTLPDALANTILNDQTNTHPACTAVFETNELLYLVLSQVPKGPLTTLLRVSRTWNSVVRKIGYCMQPANPRANESIFLPEYPESIREHIDFHSIIVACADGIADQFNNKLRIWTMSFRVDNHYPSVLHRFGHQYLTSPPITHLTLRVVRPNDSGHGFLASLRVKDGIRLRDVTEVLDKLHRSTPLECLYYPESVGGFHDFVFDADIRCARAESERKVFERKDRMCEEVRGWRTSMDLWAPVFKMCDLILD